MRGRLRRRSVIRLESRLAPVRRSRFHQHRRMATPRALPRRRLRTARRRGRTSRCHCRRFRPGFALHPHQSRRISRRRWTHGISVGHRRSDPRVVALPEPVIDHGGCRMGGRSWIRRDSGRHCCRRRRTPCRRPSDVLRRHDRSPTSAGGGYVRLRARDPPCRVGTNSEVRRLGRGTRVDPFVSRRQSSLPSVPRVCETCRSPYTGWAAAMTSTRSSLTWSRRSMPPTTVVFAGLFIAAAATSNWAIENVGHDNGPSAPRTLPIGWGLDAPSGVVLVGVMITLRDALHERVGLRGTLLVILFGSIVSALLAPAAIAMASGVTLLVAETTDALVYQRLRRRGRLRAAFASNLVSSIVDSALFLIVAYGLEAARHDTWALTVGKVEASVITLAILAVVMRSFRAPSANTGEQSTA